MAISLAITPFGDSESVLHAWWQWALIAVVAFGISAGVLTFLVSLIFRLKTAHQIRSQSTALTPKVLAHIRLLTANVLQEKATQPNSPSSDSEKRISDALSSPQGSQQSPTTPPRKRALLRHRTRGYSPNAPVNFDPFKTPFPSPTENIPSPSSVTVFLGSLEFPPTPSQSRLLCQSDILILDPNQRNVLLTLASHEFKKSPHRAARIDVSRYRRNGASLRSAALCEPSVGLFALPPTEQSEFLSAEDRKMIIDGGRVSNEPPPLKRAVKVPEAEAKDFLDRLVESTRNDISANGKQVFNAVIVAEWDGVITISLLEAAAVLLRAMGLDVYLEASSPAFFDREGPPNLSYFSGVVVQNATILPNGQIRDFFQMDRMKSLVKATVSQACLREFPLIIWESIEDDKMDYISPAIKGRCYGWSKYHGGIVDLNPSSAYYNADLHLPDREPTSAFRWLKTQTIMDIHELYRTTDRVATTSQLAGNAYYEISTELPSLEWVAQLAGQEQQVEYNRANLREGQDPRNLRASFCLTDWNAACSDSPTHPLSISPLGTSYAAYGAVPVGLDITADEFEAIAESQLRLRRLNLLDRVSMEELSDLSEVVVQAANKLNQLNPSEPGAPAGSPAMATGAAHLNRLVQTLDSLADWLTTEGAVYRGKDAGFRVPHREAQAWSCYVYDDIDGGILLFVSIRATDFVGTIVHTWLAEAGFTRAQCLWVEDFIFRMTAANQASSKGWKSSDLPPRLEQDLGILTPSEMILLWQHLQDSGVKDSIIRRIQRRCKQNLLWRTSFRQHQRLGNVDYIRGVIPPEGLVAARLRWYAKNGVKNVENFPLDQATQIFTDIDYFFKRGIEGDPTVFPVIENLLRSISEEANAEPKDREAPRMDMQANFVLFCIFAAARKYAFEEVYIEVTDRNPLYNQYTDQAAALSELFALGSRCDVYFDISPNVMGEILSEKHRAWYMRTENQPPLWIDNAPAPLGVYGAAQTDMGVDPSAPHGGGVPEKKGAKPGAVPRLQRFTFLSVFAIPALVDIVLLTITGHGLYLSAFMSKDEMRHATLALMISLLLSGGIGTWISIGATYYISSMAFSAANMFILTRLVGGLAFSVIAGLIGFAIILGIDGWRSGLVFFLYFVVLTSYLSILAAISGYQAIGTSFLNGRVIIMAVLPSLLISPIITTFVGDYDIVIYLLVLYLFIILLIFGLRHVASEWVTWYSRIKTVDDESVKKWYLEECSVTAKQNDFDNMSAPAQTRTARLELLQQVIAEKDRGYFSNLFRKLKKQKVSSPGKQLVVQLAQSWPATVFLLNWYCALTDVQRPMPYTSTWNIQVRVALDTLLQNQKGIRLHNSFIHWRHAGHEVGCGILYFIVALMDRWVELFFGGPLVGLSAGTNKTLRMATGFGLAYYLIGAVLLDYKAHHLHHPTERAPPLSVSSPDVVHAALIREARFRQKLYFTTLLRFLSVQSWTLAITALLVWVFAGDDPDGLGMFLSYVAAYSGLLLYQYNKIFAGPYALAPLLTAVIVGLPTGILLRYFQRHLLYVNVIGLAFSTWLAAILSIHSAKIITPRKVKLPETTTGAAASAVFHGYTGGGSDSSTDPSWSQAELEALYSSATANSTKVGRCKVLPGESPGDEVSRMLSALQNPEALTAAAQKAFPNIDELVNKTMAAWQEGKIRIDVVGLRKLVPRDAALSGVSKQADGRLHVLIAGDADEEENGNDMFDNTNLLNKKDRDLGASARAIAEILLHAAGEFLLGIPHHHATILEHLFLCKADGSVYRSQGHAISEGLRQRLTSSLSGADIASLASSAQKRVLLNLCFGLNPDLWWEELPETVRRAFLARCLGQACPDPATMVSLVAPAVRDAGYLLHHDEPGLSPETRVARYDLGAHLELLNYSHFREQYPAHLHGSQAQKIAYATQLRQDADVRRLIGSSSTSNVPQTLLLRLEQLRRAARIGLHKIGVAIKFVTLAPVADLEYQRELDCTLMNFPRFIAGPIVYLLTLFWRFCRAAQSFVFPFFLLHGRPELTDLWKAIRGPTTELLSGDRLSIKADGKTVTGFIHKENDQSFGMYVYPGQHTVEPDRSRVAAIGMYDSKTMRLLRRAEYMDGNCVNEYVYDYTGSGRIPRSRICVTGRDEGSVVQYNTQGFMESGSYRSAGSGAELVRFKYHYRANAKFDDELLRAEFILPRASVNVSWAAPPVRNSHRTDKWIPHSRVREATVVLGPTVYEAQWIYNHQHHPVIKTRRNGEHSETPEIIANDTLGLLQKPTRCGFRFDDPLLPFRSPRSNFLQRWLGFSMKRTAVRTAAQRSMLWKAWKNGTTLDGVVTRWLDERLLRRERVLRPYWRRRDRGSLKTAERYLVNNADTVSASAELANDISAWTPLAMRLGDMFAFGPGGDSIFYTRTKSLQPDTEDSVHVIASDTGTWPNEGGGVSACRRDLINNLHSVRWHMLVESANDFGFPKHQTEENVESLKIVPLWGLDFMSPTHGMFYNKLDSEVDDMAVTRATTDDIERNFVPTLSALVRGARAETLTAADLKQASRALVRLNCYFSNSRHWKAVWESEVVKACWRRLWLADLPQTRRTDEWFAAELPTIAHLDAGLELWFRYLFVFSIPIPDRVPTVFQASHHSVAAAYGVVCKLRRNCMLQIWDHAISWRETNLYLSAALCTLPPFIRNSLLGLMRLTSALILHHADVVLPCTDTFNPGWEVEIGTGHGKISHRAAFRRKIDPIVNGITDMDKFAPVQELSTTTPTVTMLSHLWLAKDIKSALLAADVIINKWGFKDYALDVYGALNKAPVYSSECQELIATKGLSPKVQLRGTADPGKVLKSAWLFLNSSVSEGLPLALGEAALTGAPVVATDVGASLRVLTDPETGDRFSEVVAPNDPLSLARAQINLLAMLGPWAHYTDEKFGPNNPAPVLPEHPTADDVAWITQRMYDKAPFLRALGMRARDVVQASFSGDRYLREHEQMLWVGKGHWDSLGIDPPPVLVDEDGEIVGPADAATVSAIAAAGGHLDPALGLGEGNDIERVMGMTQAPRPAWLNRDALSASRTSSFTSIYSELGMSTTPPAGSRRRRNSQQGAPGSNGSVINHSIYGQMSEAASSLSVVSGARLRERERERHGYTHSSRMSRASMSRASLSVGGLSRPVSRPVSRPGSRPGSRPVSVVLSGMHIGPSSLGQHNGTSGGSSSGS